MDTTSFRLEQDGRLSSFSPMDAESPPALVILDLMMPIVTGWQVLEAIQHDPALVKVPVVIVSATCQDKPTGAAAFLRKPFPLSVLLETVQRLRVPPS